MKMKCFQMGIFGCLLTFLLNHLYSTRLKIGNEKEENALSWYWQKAAGFKG
jgi:hypothetical protein